MLVHICCSVDSHFFLEKLQKDFPNEKLIGFFYDPNIHPYSEYALRLLDVQRSCKKLGIELLEGEYDFDEWLKIVEGLEDEPEKAKRCEVCFDRRFEVSANKALELGEKKFTTTLLVSPLKSQEQLKRSGKAFYKKHGVEFIAVDYRSGGGTQEQSRVTKEQQLYRQDYCGCIFGLRKQRFSQEKLMDEMFCSISKQVLPASIEERLAFYKHRMELDEQNIAYKIVKQKFLNYRQFFFKVTEKKTNILDAYALSYSLLPRKKAQGRVEFSHNDIHYFNREEIVFLSVEKFNTLLEKNYKNVKEILANAPTFQEEQNLRLTLLEEPYNLSPIIILDKIPQNKLEIFLDAVTYDDIKEKLIII